MPLSSLMNDQVTLVRQDGTRIEKIKAHSALRRVNAERTHHLGVAIASLAIRTTVSIVFTATATVASMA
jgi:superfamily II DNA helicase RecQ